MDEGSLMYVICDVIQGEDESEENSAWRFEGEK